MRLYRYILSLISLVFYVVAYSQEPLPYNCNFSEPSEEGEWVLNSGNTSKFANKWYVDSLEAAFGNMLYISADTGHTAGYCSKDNIVVAYRTLDMAKGDYDVAFDWRAMGRDSLGACLYLVWCPDSYLVKTNRKMSSLSTFVGEGSFPTWMRSYKVDFTDGAENLFGTEAWAHAVAELHCPTTEKYHLAFVWVNKNFEEVAPPAACIDNIELAASDCGRPERLSALWANGEVTFEWEGTADKYQIMYTRMDSNEWITDSVTTNSYTVGGLAKGVFNVRVRAICGEDTTIWSHFPLTCVYDEGQCMNFLNLNEAVCTHGNFLNPYQDTMVLDKGYESIFSSHTIHYDVEETDPRTDDGTTPPLKTVPTGAVASVRLGNWGVGALAESITYDYYVDADVAEIMLLHYAVVIEEPGHPEERQPRFRLEILHSDGKTLIDQHCGFADFKANDKMSIENGWHKIEHKRKTTILWRDWTTVGLNLEAYSGQTLKVRLTTYDCFVNGHFGYAYFTIGCAEKAIKGVNCGEYPTTDFEAPGGFNYRWYRADSPVTDTLGRERVFHLDDQQDYRTYFVDCIYPEDSTCKFTLRASAMPRNPKALMKMEYWPENCKNYVVFNDTSRVLDKDGNVMPEEYVDAVEWYFGEGRKSNEHFVKMEFPESGYKRDSCYLVANLCGGLCSDTLWFYLDVPPIGAVEADSTVYLCVGDEIVLQDSLVAAPGEYRFVVGTAFTGCDSAITYHVTEAETYELSDTVQIMQGEIYEFGLQSLNETGDYSEHFTSVYGCDSLVHLHLEVLSRLDIEPGVLTEICADDDSIVIPYVIVEGQPRTVGFVFGEDAKAANFTDVEVACIDGEDRVAIGMPEDVLPGIYNVELLFSNGAVGRDTIGLRLDIRYPSSVIAQRWNDVIGILNSEHNGGYEFSDYRWFENDVLVDGATGSNLYLPSGLRSDAGYSALLTRTTDGVAQYTCKFFPADLTAADNLPTVYFAGSQAVLEAPQNTSGCQVRIYRTDGTLVSAFHSADGLVEIQMPHTPGVYLLEQQCPDSHSRITKVLVKQ